MIVLRGLYRLVRRWPLKRVVGAFWRLPQGRGTSLDLLAYVDVRLLRTPERDVETIYHHIKMATNFHYRMGWTPTDRSRSRSVDTIYRWLRAGLPPFLLLDCIRAGFSDTELDDMRRTGTVPDRTAVETLLALRGTTPVQRSPEAAA